MTEADDLLLERSRQGDQAAFETLSHRYYALVYRSVYRLVGSREAAEDLVQETFLAVTPLSVLSVRSPAMVVSGVVYAATTLVLAMRAFSRRDL